MASKASVNRVAHEHVEASPHLDWELFKQRHKVRSALAARVESGKQMEVGLERLAFAGRRGLSRNGIACASQH